MTVHHAHHEYAGLVSRFAAYLTDAVIVAAGTISLGAGIAVVSLAVSSPGRDIRNVVVPALLAATPLVLAAYEVVFWGLVGRTPGMALLGVRVVRTDGQPVSWLAALIRAIVLACFPIGALWSLVDRRRQAVHDKLARTAVVREIPE